MTTPNSDRRIYQIYKDYAKAQAHCDLLNDANNMLYVDYHIETKILEE